MKITDYNFTNNDIEYNLIKDFVKEAELYPDFDNNWDPGRMDFWRYNIHSNKGEEFFISNVHFWKTEKNKVVGLFISEYGGDDFFLLVHPDFPGLFAEALNWGILVWGRGKKKITTPVYSIDQDKVDRLKKSGFYEDGHDSNFRYYNLKKYDFFYRLESGYQLMAFDDYGNYESRINLVREAFSYPAYAEKNLRSLQSSPEYQTDLHLVIVNSRGESVSYCMGWINENDRKLGNIEPMGTHPDYRRKGFATILIKESFKRFSKMGVETVTIASNAEPDISNYLYDSLNPVKIKRSYKYSINL